MVTLEYVNNQVNLFNGEHHFNIPFFTKIVNDRTGVSGANVNIPELKNNKLILHYNDIIEKYSLQSLNGLLLHEFTHVYDFMFRYKDDRRIYSIMNSISESNAMETQYRYLINLSEKQNVVDILYIIPYVNENFEIGKIIKIYVRRSWEYLNDFSISKKPEDFVYGIKNWFYFLGAIKVLIDGEKYPSVYLSKFNAYWRKYLLDIFESYTNNDIDGIIKNYNILEFNAREYSGVR